MVKRRRSSKGRKERLKDNLYKAAIMGIVGDPTGINPELLALFDKAADEAVASGIPEFQLKALVGKALKDAKEISKLVEEHDVLVKVVGQGWEIVTESEA